MIKLGNIERQEKSTIYENKVSTYITKEKIYYPKGIISYPKKGEHSIVININNNSNTRVLIPIQTNEETELQEGDVMITDDNETIIHLKSKDNEILIKSKKVVFESENEILIKSKKVVFESEVEFSKDVKLKEGVTNKGKDIGKDHTHKFDKFKSGTIPLAPSGTADVNAIQGPADTTGVN